MSSRTRYRCVSEITAAADGALPTEFCLFVAGANPNYNADAKGAPQPVFTAESAKRVASDAARKGTDYFMDLEHASVAEERPAGATDAMCWYQIEVRADGSCWAVNVRWTPEGERRLRAKSQRYISPVFWTDRETGEILEFCGCALTSDPATYGIAPLVAASRLARTEGHDTPAALTRPRARTKVKAKRMDPALLKKALDAVTADDGAAAIEILKSMLTEGAPEEAPADPAMAAADPPQPNPDEQPVAASKELEAANARIAKLEAQAAARDAKERGELVAELVALKIETPATAFKAGKLVSRLAAEPIDELRERVAVHRGSAPKRIEPPTTEDAEAPQLSANVAARVATMNPAQKAQFDRYQRGFAARRG